ncbi:nonsense-mediated mRNA decay factor SMG9-like isoform X2 [Ornithodoros turicata]|uniref:nonsense-mediated mRNA decay factor SMG9-like isoform X2 n=1 Tax=Ornithodoros turicata TaxID=34597 RepID=UPI0031396598
MSHRAPFRPHRYKDRYKESEQDQDSSKQQPIKPVVILAKHHDRSSSAAPLGDGGSSAAGLEGSAKAPQLLIKGASRASSPAAAGSSSKDDSSGTVASSQPRAAQKVPSTETLEERLALPPDMAAPVKLVDDSLQWCDNALEYLVDQPDFYVIGVIGLQGAGKSTLMSILAGGCGKGGDRHLFVPQSRELRELGQHCTSGIDIYVTAQRTILLDTQPVLSGSAMDHMIQFEKKTPGGGDFHSLENAHMMQSLQTASFLMAVCHTIVVVQDWFADINFLRFVLTAEMLKPATSTTSHELGVSNENAAESYPHIVFVQNKCTPGDFSPENIQQMQGILKAIFGKSKLKYKGSVNPDSVTERKESAVNLFLLPKKLTERDEKNRKENKLPGFQDGEQLDRLSMQLLSQIQCMPKPHLSQGSLTEKNWLFAGHPPTQ